MIEIFSIEYYSSKYNSDLIRRSHLGDSIVTIVSTSIFTLYQFDWSLTILFPFYILVKAPSFDCVQLTFTNHSNRVTS